MIVFGIWRFKKNIFYVHLQEHELFLLGWSTTAFQHLIRILKMCLLEEKLTFAKIVTEINEA